ncbi:MAG: anthranilate synthase component I family protein [Halobacteriales archaeon]
MDSPNPQIEVYTDKHDYLSVAATSPSSSRIPVEVRVVVDDPFKAYLNSREGSQSFYLETTGGTPGWGYFGIRPSAFLEINSDSPTSSSALSQLYDFFAKEHLVRNGCETPYPCGVVGWLSYELAKEIENIPPRTDTLNPFPLLQAGLYDCIVSWKEPRDEKTTLRITSCPIVEIPEETFDTTLTTTIDLARSLQIPSPPFDNLSDAPSITDFKSDCGNEIFCERVREIKQHIRDGDTFQVNTAHNLTLNSDISPSLLFSALRQINPAPYSSLFEFPNIDLIGVSPELLFRLEDDLIIAEPIAGTRPRGANASDDLALENELINSPKERAEHAMLVDLCRNDIGKIAEYGTVHIDEYCRVDRYSAVMHLVSTVKGTLHPTKNILDIIKAMFPGGTITGAPKPRTMEIINELETSYRGPYTGSVGIFGFDNRATLNIIIRTFIHQNETYFLPVGSGIVHDSSPELEYEETLSKARALVQAMNLALSDPSSLE